MSASAAMVAQLRRWVDEPDSTTYTDEDLAAYIEKYPLIDELGTNPRYVDYTTSPPTVSEADNWIPTYDVHAAARDVWEEKAGAVAEDYDFQADGASLSRSQVRESYMKQARYHGSRRAAGTTESFVEPRRSPKVEDNRS